MTDRPRTPFVETELVLAAADDDLERCDELIALMTRSERRMLLETLDVLQQRLEAKK